MSLEASKKLVARTLSGLDPNLAKQMYPTISRLSRSARDDMRRRLKRLIRKKQVDKIISTLMSEWDVPIAEARDYAITVCKDNRADDLKGAAVPPSQAGSKKKKTDLMQVIADKGGTLKEVTEIGIRRGMTRDAAIEKARKMMGKKHKTTFVRFVQGGAPK